MSDLKRYFYISIGFTCLFSGILYAQKIDHNWFFGQNAGLDFNDTTPQPLYGELNTIEGCASISNDAGELLFYTDGVNVWDRRHRLMPHGFKLKGGISSSQSAVIVPIPGSYTKYYLFTVEQPPGAGLRYSIVDMELNNGYGDIIPFIKNRLLLENTTEKQTAVKHTNKRDIWLITHELGSNNFFSTLITDQGIVSTPVISSVGLQHGTDDFSYIGTLKASSSGKYLASSIPYHNEFEFYDFNASTGVISNPRSLPFPFEDGRTYGMEFSPNDSLLYVETWSFFDSVEIVFQVPFLDANPEMLEVFQRIAHFESVGSFQLGPDGKIYITKFGNRLDVIHQPDVIGPACQYSFNSISLLEGTGTTYGLPQRIVTTWCPLIDLGSDQTRCVGDSVVLSITVDSTQECPLSLIWYDGTSDREKVISETGSYWVDVILIDSVYRDSITITFEPELNTTISKVICQTQIFEGYSETGIHIDTFPSVFGCDSIRTLDLTVVPHFQSTIEGSILSGGSFEGYEESGIYIDTFKTSSGCDSIRTLRLTVLQQRSIIRYTLDNCSSVMSLGTHMDYSEFTPVYPNSFECAGVSAGILHRESTQKHSCTPGTVGSEAMCVSILEECSYIAGHPASIIIEFDIDVIKGESAQITRFSFLEKSPLEYNWLQGPSGPNQGPAYYGIRILKNNIEIFRDEGIETEKDWNEEIFNFYDVPAFRCDTHSHFRIELLPFCPDGPPADESVWDIEYFNIYAACITPIDSQLLLGGIVEDISGNAMRDIRVELSNNANFNNIRYASTDEEGQYQFSNLAKHESYYVRCYKNDDIMSGVSVMDMLRIQKHLLGIERFSSLPLWIAADIDHNDKVNVLDMVAFANVVLGRIPGFPNNTSWRFGVWPQDFGHLNLSQFQETRLIKSLQTSENSLNFIGIKIGDVY